MIIRISLIFSLVSLLFSCNKQKEQKNIVPKLDFVINESLNKLIFQEMEEFSKHTNYNLVKLKYQKKANIDYVLVSTSGDYIQDSILYCQKINNKLVFVYKSSNPEINKIFYSQNNCDSIPKEFLKYKYNSNNPNWSDPWYKIFKVLKKDSIVPYNEKFEDNLFISLEIPISYK